MAFVLCRSCRSRLFNVAVSPSNSQQSQPLLLPLLRPSRRGLKPSPAKIRSPSTTDQPAKSFIIRIAQLPESPLTPISAPSAGSGGSGAIQLAARFAAALAAGGLLCLVVGERRDQYRQSLVSDSASNDDSNQQQQQQPLLAFAPFDFGYADHADATLDGAERLLRDLRLAAPCLIFFTVSLALGNLLRSKRMSAATLAKLCRHVFDQPGRSALLTSPWLSSFCSMHGSEFLLAACAMYLLSVQYFGFSPEEKVLAFVTGALAGSAGRAAYQRLATFSKASPRLPVISHWYGAHAGIAVLVGLLVLSWRRDAGIAQQLASGDQAGQRQLGGMSRSAQRFLLDLRPGACSAVLAGWAVYDVACLALFGWRLPLVIGAVAQPLKHVSTLSGLAAACGIHAGLELRPAVAAVARSDRTAAAGSEPASA